MITRLQAESGARIQVAPGNAFAVCDLIISLYICIYTMYFLFVDGSEINGERQVTISGTQDTVE